MAADSNALGKGNGRPQAGEAARTDGDGDGIKRGGGDAGLRQDVSDHRREQGRLTAPAILMLLRQNNVAGDNASRTAPEGRIKGEDDQWRKCRMPVSTMAMPALSAAAITSPSRIEPPGWMTAVAPAAMAASRPSANGKNASEATTLPMVSA